MKLQRLTIQFSILLLLPFFSCEKTIIEQVNGDGTVEGKTYSIEGYAQKGPFIVGTDVTVSELNDKLFPTGRVFFATILDDKGYFELPGVVLESQYVQIKVRGRYFSETGGYIPTEELTLYSLADITKSETINVNILTHLEKERVEYLVQHESHSFETAKEKAQSEILTIFEWGNISVDESIGLDISKDDNGGALLLAISSLFENIEFVKKIETITLFKTDIAQDGILDSEQIQNRLLTSAALLNQENVREVMEIKYDAKIPDFEIMINTFINNSSYVNYFELMFPKESNGKVNLVRYVENSLNSLNDYSVTFGDFPEVDGSFGQVVINTYPNDSDSDLSSNSELWKQINSGGQCNNNPDEICSNRLYNYWTTENSSLIELPIAFTGSGKLSISIEIWIDGVFTTRIYEKTW